MQRVERHIILKNKKIDRICFLSKNLYNAANYIIRQEFIKNRKWIRYAELDKSMQPTIDYKDLPSNTAQQILRLLDKNWSSFFRAIKQWNKNKELFIGKPKLPKYKDKVKGRNIVIFTNNQISIKDGFVCFPKKANLQSIKTKVQKIDQVRIVPQATCYVLEIVYTKEVKDVKLKLDTYLSIDIGVNNLATCVNNIGLQPFVVNGRALKSINQYYNKKKATFQRFVKNRFSNRLRSLTYKRNNKVEDYLHKASRFIVNYCLEHKLSIIIIGKNLNWKKEINTGKINNQNFVSIPFDRLIKQISYKAEEYGIKVFTNEESYTSKCSFLDLEEVCKHTKYLGRRIKRGLFRSAKKILINTDVNGAYNILRKVVPNIFDNGIEDVGLHPVMVNLA